MSFYRIKRVRRAANEVYHGPCGEFGGTGNRI